MKQLLFLLLFPCLALAQYQGNANQKITLGEQTTADGLVWRGRTSDTVNLMTNKIDTSAYLVLDTITEVIWLYRASTTPKWNRVVDSLNNLQGQLSLTTKVTGVLPVANGGTNTSTAFTQGSVVFAGASGTYSQDNSGLFFDASNNRLGVNVANPLDKFHLIVSPGENFAITRTDLSIDSASIKIGNTTNTAGFFIPGFIFVSNASTGGNFISQILNNSIDDIGMRIDARKRVTVNQSAGRLSIGSVLRATNFDLPLMSINYKGDMILMNGTSTTVVHPTEKLHVVGNARITAMNGINDIGASATGVLQAATSDMNLKNTIENSPFGLNEILLLNPVTFLYNDENRKIDSDVKEVGFIAQDVFDVIPNAVSSTGTGDLQLDYRAITAALTKAIQEQQTLIKALEQRILTLENK